MTLRSWPTAWRQWIGHTLEERDRPRDRREATLLGVAALFVVANVVALGVATDEGWAWPRLLWPGVWLVVSALGPDDFVLRPLPNSYFTRDPSAWIYGGVAGNPMYWPARRLGVR